MNACGDGNCVLGSMYADYQLDASAQTRSFVCTIHIFSELEEQWPKDNASLRLRVHGIRYPGAEGKLTNRKNASFQEEFAKLNFVMRIAQTKESIALINEDNFDLTLIGGKSGENGLIEGKLKGKLPNGFIVKDLAFTLIPWQVNDRPFDPAAMDDLAKRDSSKPINEPRPRVKTDPWQNDIGAFIDEVEKDVKAHSDMAETLVSAGYTSKPIAWKLKFMRLKENRSGSEVEFDLTPYGMDPPKRLVCMSFTPAIGALSDWKKLKQGSVITVQASYNLSMFTTMMPIGRNIGIVLVDNVKILQAD